MVLPPEKRAQDMRINWGDSNPSARGNSEHMIFESEHLDWERIGILGSLTNGQIIPQNDDIRKIWKCMELTSLSEMSRVQETTVLCILELNKSSWLTCLNIT